MVTATDGMGTERLPQKPDREGGHHLIHEPGREIGLIYY
jgi:hypothetical protein